MRFRISRPEALFSGTGLRTLEAALRYNLEQSTF
jgi:hypothetical protein